jgi:hypothetical protein
MFDILRCVMLLKGENPGQAIEFASEEDPPTECWGGLGEVRFVA